MTYATRTAILVSHGQPSSPKAPEARLAQLAAQVAEHLPNWELRSATLAMPGQLERVMTEGAQVYPFFMSSGWFTTTVLPRRLQGVTHRILPPFGLDADLPPLVARALQSLLPASEPLLLAAHGSARGPKAAEAAESFAAKLAPLRPASALHIGYVEQAPSLADMAQALPAHGYCLPFFAQAGDHVSQDIPAALRQTGLSPERILPTIGELPGVPQLIARAIASS